MITKTGKRLVEEHRLDKQASLAIGLGTAAGAHLGQNLIARRMMRGMAEKGGIGDYLLHALATGKAAAPKTISSGVKDALLPERRILIDHLGETGKFLHEGISEAAANAGGKLNPRTAVMMKWILSGDFGKLVRYYNPGDKNFMQAMELAKQVSPMQYEHFNSILQSAAKKLPGTPASGESLLSQAIRNHGAENVHAKAMEAIDEMSNAVKSNELTGGIAEVFRKPHLMKRIQEASGEVTGNEGAYNTGRAIAHAATLASEPIAEAINASKAVLGSKYMPKSLGNLGNKALSWARQTGGKLFVSEPLRKAYEKGYAGHELSSLNNGAAINLGNAVTGNARALANKMGVIAHNFSGAKKYNGTLHERIMSGWNK